MIRTKDGRRRAASIRLSVSVRLLAARPQLVEFENTLWPVCIEQGLVDDELTEQLAAKRVEVFGSTDGFRVEPSTKSIRNRY